MSQAKTGDTVTIGFKVSLMDGRIVAATNDDKEETLVLGSGKMFPAFEQQIVGMEVGDKKTAQVAAHDAFGPHNPELQFEIERANLPQDQQPAVGMQLQSQHPNGQQMNLTIIEVNPGSVKVDANHPLAGQDLLFEVELHGIIAGL